MLERCYTYSHINVTVWDGLNECRQIFVLVTKVVHLYFIYMFYPYCKSLYIVHLAIFFFRFEIYRNFHDINSWSCLPDFVSFFSELWFCMQASENECFSVYSSRPSIWKNESLHSFVFLLNFWVIYS